MKAVVYRRYGGPEVLEYTTSRTRSFPRSARWCASGGRAQCGGPSRTARASMAILNDRSRSTRSTLMARPRQFDADTALDAAIGVFREHGFEGASAEMLVGAMGIGRQSLYDTFGDKWRLYRSAVRRYGLGECAAHFEALRSGVRAIDGIDAMLRRVVETADQPCLGVGSTCEFGGSRPDLAEVHAPLAKALGDAIAARVRDAQRDGDVASELTPEAAAEFLIANIAGIRVAGRGVAWPTAPLWPGSPTWRSGRCASPLFDQFWNIHSSKEQVDESGRYEGCRGP
jgi:TetR/AcrR family transcriptional repressor of nem operon